MWLLQCKNKHYWESANYTGVCPECGLNACGGSRILFPDSKKSLGANLEGEGYHEAVLQPSKEEG